jgi:hypothetical protein
MPWSFPAVDPYRLEAAQPDSRGVSVDRCDLLALDLRSVADFLPTIATHWLDVFASAGPRCVSIVCSGVRRKLRVRGNLDVRLGRLLVEGHVCRLRADG